MMQTLANILLVPNAESIGDQGAALAVQPFGQKGESFDALMSRAITPVAPEKIIALNPDGQMNVAAPGTERWNKISTHKPPQTSPAQIRAAKDAKNIEPESDTPELEEKPDMKANRKYTAKTTGYNFDKSPDAPVLVDLGVVPDNSQNLPIQMLAPALAACLLTSFAPKLDAKNATTTAGAPVSVSQLETGAGTKNSMATLTVITGTGKNPAPADGAALGVAVSINPKITGAVPALSADEQKNVAEIIRTQDAQKINPAETKVAEATTASAQASNLKSAAEISSDLAPLNISTAEALPSPEIPAAPDSVKEAAVTTAFQVHGTAVAQQEVPMKKELKTNKVAGQGEKDLPGSVMASVSEKSLPVRGNFAAANSVHPTPTGASTSDVANNSLTTGQTVAATNNSSDGKSVSSNVIDMPARAMERTHDMVALHALRLVDIKSDSMQVVIKPGSGIQLSLELRQRGDGVEAHAVLQQGDFSQMNQHWSELQQRLEQRGIRLAPLTGSENSAAFGGGNEFQKQQRQTEEQDPLAAGAFAAFAMAGAAIAPSGHAAIYAGVPGPETNINNIMTPITSATTAAVNSTDSLASATSTLNQNDFLKLLVAQMQYQDPMNPQSDTEMASQMAQFTSLQQATQSTSSLAMIQANGLVGNTVTLQVDSQTTATGVVQGVVLNSGTPQIMVDGSLYNLNQVTSITPTPAPQTTAGSSAN
jgi:flagellar basal-body rod modification protein FlgD